MVTLELIFPANRYHATAWGTHVNEGVIEWPPSPWRLLRAIIATWHLKEEAHGDISEETLASLIGKLSESLPKYQVPDSWAGHTRHYMPIANGKTTKVFDAFLHISKPLQIQWDCELGPDENEALRSLVPKLNYLGRAESLVSLELLDKPDPIFADAYPIGESGESDETRSTKRILPLLCPVSDSEFSSELEKLNSKKTPASLMAAMRTDTADFKKDGWSQPPGSRWIQYLVPDKSPKVSSGTRLKGESSSPTVARFAVVSNVAPSITQALSIGDRVHATVVKCSDGAAVFTGTDPETNEPMLGHQHAHIFPESTNHRGTVNFLSVYAAMGFEGKARKALEAVRKTWGYGGHDLQVILLGVGEAKDFGGTNYAAGQSAVFAKSRVWQSVTPFVPTRHAKATRTGVPKMDPENLRLQIGSPEHDLRRLLKLRNFPEIVNCDYLGERGNIIPVGGREIPCLKFQRQRKNGNGRSAADGRGYGFRIEFSEPVRGPVCAGYGSHFGLGLFVPADS